MGRTRNISVGVPAALHARYAALGMAARRAVLADVRALLESRLQAGVIGVGQADVETAAHGGLPSSPAGLNTEAEPAQGGMLADGGAAVALPSGW
jgi:hypothetical protein